jgi:hypothetical protein
VITPPERPRSELLVPLAGGSIGALGWPALGRLPRSWAETAATIKDKNAVAMMDTLSIPVSTLARI